MAIRAWDASGQYLAPVDITTERKVCVTCGTTVVPVDTGRQVLTVDCSSELANIFGVQARFSNLGWLAIHWLGGNLEVWDVPQGECIFVLEAGPTEPSLRSLKAKYTSMCWSHCGSLLAVAEASQDASSWDVAVYGREGNVALLRTTVAGENVRLVTVRSWSLADTSFLLCKHFVAQSSRRNALEVDVQVVKPQVTGLLGCKVFYCRPISV